MCTIFVEARATMLVKTPHMMVKVEFPPLGLAHFSTTFEDKDYQFQSTLPKFDHKGNTYDKGT